MTPDPIDRYLEAGDNTGEDFGRCVDAVKLSGNTYLVGCSAVGHYIKIYDLTIR